MQPQDSKIWLGASDQKQEGVWMWQAEEKVAKYTRFNPGEPSAGNGENCLAMVQENGNWGDQSCASTLNFNICEKQLEKPSATPSPIFSVFFFQKSSSSSHSQGVTHSNGVSSKKCCFKDYWT